MVFSPLQPILNSRQSTLLQVQIEISFIRSYPFLLVVSSSSCSCQQILVGPPDDVMNVKIQGHQDLRQLFI